jgi:hypothetical protein
MRCIGMYSEWFAFKIFFTMQHKDGYSCDSVLLEDTVQELSPYVLVCNLLLTLHSQNLQTKFEVPRHAIEMSKESRQ